MKNTDLSNFITGSKKQLDFNVIYGNTITDSIKQRKDACFLHYSILETLFLSLWYMPFLDCSNKSKVRNMLSKEIVCVPVFINLLADK